MHANGKPERISYVGFRKAALSNPRCRKESLLAMPPFKYYSGKAMYCFHHNRRINGASAVWAFLDEPGPKVHVASFENEVDIPHSVEYKNVYWFTLVDFTNSYPYISWAVSILNAKSSRLSKAWYLHSTFQKVEESLPVFLKIPFPRDIWNKYIRHKSLRLWWWKNKWRIHTTAKVFLKLFLVYIVGQLYPVWVFVCFLTVLWFLQVYKFDLQPTISRLSDSGCSGQSPQSPNHSPWP